MTTEQTITGRECRFAIHMPSYRSDIPDFHLVKEAVHHADGSITPNIRFRDNFQRDFYVTAQPFRNHKQKKEYEHLDKLIKYTCTQSELPRRVAESLGLGHLTKPQLKQLTESPYLYGSDVSSSSIIKHQYMKRWPGLKTAYTIGYFDIETDMLKRNDEPILITFIFGKKIYQAGLRSFFKNQPDIEGTLERHIAAHIQPYMEKHQFEHILYLTDDVVDMIRWIFDKIHKDSPDFLAIWNMNFDVNCILNVLKKRNVDAKDIFSDPRVPEELRFCRFKKGSTKKVTASGKVQPKKPSEQWHSVYCPAGFYIIDAMCSYHFVRQGEQELESYGLDFVLDKVLGIRKLNFAAADHVDKGTPDWHIFMQERYPFEYTVYNIFDCIGMVELENKVHDLAMKVPILSGVSDFSRFNSQTKKFADSFHFYMLRRGGVAATIPPKEEVEGSSAEDIPEEEEEVYDADADPEIIEAFAKEDVLSLRDWINKIVPLLGNQYRTRYLIVWKPLTLSHHNVA